MLAPQASVLGSPLVRKGRMLTGRSCCSGSRARRLQFKRCKGRPGCLAKKVTKISFSCQPPRTERKIRSEAPDFSFRAWRLAAERYFGDFLRETTGTAFTPLELQSSSTASRATRPSCKHSSLSNQGRSKYRGLWGQHRLNLSAIPDTCWSIVLAGRSLT